MTFDLSDLLEEVQNVLNARVSKHQMYQDPSLNCIPSVITEAWNSLLTEEDLRPQDEEMSFKVSEPGETPVIQINQPNNVYINNSHTNPTINIQKKSSKFEQIETNLLTLANAGIQFIRSSTYHVRVLANREYWNFYLTGHEKFHRDGEPEEGRGIDNFITLIKSTTNA